MWSVLLTWQKDPMSTRVSRLSFLITIGKDTQDFHHQGGWPEALLVMTTPLLASPVARTGSNRRPSCKIRSYESRLTPHTMR